MATDKYSSLLKAGQLVPTQLPPAGLSVISTQAGEVYTNGSGASRTLNLPKAKPGAGPFYIAINAAGSPIVVQPLTADTIRGAAAGASVTYSTAGQVVEFVCFYSGTWEPLPVSGASSSGPTGIASLFAGAYAQTYQEIRANTSTVGYDNSSWGFNPINGGLNLTALANPPAPNATYTQSLGLLSYSSNVNQNLPCGIYCNQLQYSMYQSGSGSSKVGNWSVGIDLMIGALVSTGRIFFGVSQYNTNVLNGNIDPSAVNQLVGFSKDSGDTNLQMICRNGSTATKVDTGIAATSLVGVGLAITLVSTVTNVQCTLWNIDNGTQLYQGNASATLPQSGVTLAPSALLNTGPISAVAVVLNIARVWRSFPAQ